VTGVVPEADAGFADDRHARHRMIDWFDADRLAATHALVAGVGAIGNEVVKQLALLGVGRVTVLDRDRVERSNLTRSVLFRESDLGRAKAEVVAARAAELDPSLRIEAKVADLALALRPSALDGVDVVFGGLDSIEARLRLNEVCLAAATDLVDGGIDARHASVQHLPFSAGRTLGCYACGVPPGAWRRLAERHSCGGLRRAGRVERRVPTTIVTSSAVAATMVSWGLRMGRASDRSSLARRWHFDTIDGRATVSAIARDPECPACGPLPEGRVERLRWRAGERLAIGADASRLRLRLPEPVVLSARCAACGADAAAAFPAGSRLRARGTDERRCTSCGDEAIAVEGRDALALGELLAATGGAPPALPFLWIDDDRSAFCVEIDDVR
jgi:molybdopterin/thiamine biosynthesis adenylyltransferase